MSISYQCPICDSELKVHGPSQGFYCQNRHRFDLSEQGYWIFAKPNNKSVTDSRQLMRAKRHLLESGIFMPVVDMMAKLVNTHLVDETEQTCGLQLDFDCGEGYYIRALGQSLTKLAPDFTLKQVGICEAENAIFAATKADDKVNAESGDNANQYLLGGTKKLPFAPEQFDLVTLVNKALKGKECLRVLKSGGYLLQVSPAPRHLWQIKQHIYDKLTEKPYTNALPNELTLVASERVSFTVEVSAEQAQVLLEMTPFAWRVKDKQKAKLAKGNFAELEIDFIVELARKQ